MFIAEIRQDWEGLIFFTLKETCNTGIFTNVFDHSFIRAWNLTKGVLDSFKNISYKKSVSTSNIGQSLNSCFLFQKSFDDISFILDWKKYTITVMRSTFYGNISFDSPLLINTKRMKDEGKYMIYEKRNILLLTGFQVN